jgi:oligopeptidase B
MTIIIKTISRFSFLLLGLLIFLTACNNESKQAEKTESTKISTMYEKSDLQPPVAKKVEKKLVEHGNTRIDNYFWMRLSDEQKNAETKDAQTTDVINYLNEENTYRDKMMEHLKPVTEELYQEIIGRIAQTDVSVPYKDNGYFYYSRYEEGQEYPIYCRKKENLEAEEKVILDVNVLAKDFDYYAVSSRSVSPDNQLLAYGEDTLSRRIYTIRFKNLETGEMLEDVIPNTTGRAVWANDNKTIFYTVKDKSLRSYKVFKHILGTDASKDTEVFHEADETFSCFTYKSKSEKYIIIGSFQTVSTEYRVLDADNPNSEWKIIQPRERDLEYGIAHLDDKFYIRTNLDAKNFRLMETPVTATTKDNWKEVIPHRDDVLLEDMELFNDYLVVEERIEGIKKIRIMPKSGDEHYIDFGEASYVAGTSTNMIFDTDIVRVAYTSMTTPMSVLDYNMKTKEMKLLKEQEVVGDFDKSNYVSERRYATARDGVKVPISIVYKKGYKKDGKAPLLLYAYGSYGASMDPYFSSTRLSLLDRGFAYAIAHIRGGEEMGRQWYEDGKLLNKKNTFNDYIDCGEFLIQENYTNKGQLYAMGGSAGGLLMGAVINMRPDLWNGVVAAVPFVDVISTMWDESIPLTTGEFDEWGNPKNKEYYDYILSYSPYDNVEAKEYPAMLVTTGLHDSQVQYWEPAKWVAKLRELKTDNNPLMMHTNMDAGHGGQSGRFRRFKETAMEYAFFLDLAGKVELKD